MAVGIVTAVLGIVQAGASIYKMSQEGKAPTPKEAPELRDAFLASQKRSEYGYTPAQKAAFDAKLAGEGKLAYQRGVDMGGGSLAQALNAGINAQQLGARNQFAFNDANLQNAKFGQYASMAGAIQNQSNIGANAELHQYNLRQQAYGNALKTGTENIVNGIGQNQYMNMLNSGGNYGDSYAPMTYNGQTLGTGNAPVIGTGAPTQPMNEDYSLNNMSLNPNNNGSYFGANEYSLNDPSTWNNYPNLSIGQ